MLFAKRTVHLLAAAADRYVRGREYNSSDSVPEGGEGGRRGDRQTERASCREDKFSERANVEEGARPAQGMVIWLVCAQCTRPLCYGNSCTEWLNTLRNGRLGGCGG